jgi:hypothetical protein
MFGSALLDVAIGMVFVFLLLSLICSAFNELLETRLKNRAGDLEKGIKGLLGANTGLVTKVPQHMSVGDRVKIDTRDGSFVERV